MALDKMSSNFNLDRRRFLFLNQIDQAFGSHLTHFPLRYMDGGQAWLYDIAKFDIVEPDDCNVIRNPVAFCLERAHRSDGNQIIICEVAPRRFFPLFQYLCHIGKGAFDRGRQPMDDGFGG